MSLKKRLVFSAIVTVAFFVLLEACLALFTPIKPFSPFRLSSVDHKSGSRTYTYIPNAKAPAVIMPKPQGVYRIFCFGGSAAKGWPFHGAGFPEFLQKLLDYNSQGIVEVFNLGADGCSSTMVVEVFKDSLLLDPDMCIIYSGNDELYSLNIFNRKKWPRLNRGVWWATRHLRLVQLPGYFLKTIIVHGGALLGVKNIHKFEKMNNIRLNPPEKKQFKLNLYIGNIDEIVRTARKNGVEVIVCGTGNNIRDWLPVKSVHTPGLSKEECLEIEKEMARGRNALDQGRFTEARSILLPQALRDPYYAKLSFFLGRAELQMGNIESATRYLEQAITYDDYHALHHISSNQNRILGEYCRKQNVLFLDVDMFLRGLDTQGLPGFDMFLDGCHQTVEVNYIIAKRICDVIFDYGLLKPRSDPLFIPSFKTLRPLLNLSKIEEARAYTDQALLLGFLYQHPEYLDPVFGFLEKAEELGYPVVVTRSYQGYIRVLQGRMDDASNIFSLAREHNVAGFATAIKHLLGEFVRYDGTRLDIKPAMLHEMPDLYMATLRNKPPKPPEPRDCPYHLLWDQDLSRFVSSSD